MSGSLLPAGKHPSAVPAAKIVAAVKRLDLGSKGGKSEMWRLLTPLGKPYLDEWAERRDGYLAQRFGVKRANECAVLDLAAGLPTAEGLDDEVESARTHDGSVGEVAIGASVGDSWSRLVALVLERTGAKDSALSNDVRWVAQFMVLDVPELLKRHETVPSLHALSLWRFARDSEPEFRRTYHSSLTKSKEFMGGEDRGFVDDGAPMREVFQALADAFDRRPLGHDEHMRDMPASESVDGFDGSSRVEVEMPEGMSGVFRGHGTGGDCCEGAESSGDGGLVSDQRGRASGSGGGESAAQGGSGGEDDGRYERLAEA